MSPISTITKNVDIAITDKGGKTHILQGVECNFSVDSSDSKALKVSFHHTLFNNYYISRAALLNMSGAQFVEDLETEVLSGL